MVNRFSLYDFIAILFPGIFFLWAFVSLVDGPSPNGAIPLSGGITDTSVLIVIGYVTGLMLQGVSQNVTERILLFWWGGFPSARWLLAENKRFTHEFKKELCATLVAKFNITLEIDQAKSESNDSSLKRNQEIFYRCYRSIEKLSDLPQMFNAQYGLFRSLVTTFALLVAVCTWRLVHRYRSGFGLDIEALLLASVFILGTIISYYRVTKRGEDFARSVYDVFLANFAARQ